MEGAYYLGERRHKRVGAKRWLTVCALTLLALAIWVHAALLPEVRALCETSLSNRLEALANQKAYEILADGGYSYGDFITLSYGANGSVRAASVDAVRLNLLKSSLALSVLAALTDEDVTARVPAGNLLGLLFFSGMGGDIAITARVASGMRARFQTVFTEAGINQTRHAIGFVLDFSATYLLAARKETLSFSIEIPIGETLIVGDVPDTLTQINRLSEEISEFEIDDAVDFGNIIP